MERYIAEWITAQHIDEFGEWEPYRDEYAGRVCKTLAAAKALAIERSKSANCVEWVRVKQQTFDPALGIPAAHEAAWDTTAVWCGDWQGNWEAV